MLPACSLRRSSTCTFHYEPPHDQFHSLCHWLHGLRHVAEKRLFEAAVWFVLLGAHDSLDDRRFKVQSLLLPVFSLLIVFSSHFVVNNILEGLIWFWVPASLVICNDVFAYIWGITIGRTPLIQLSPKKTVEGFVGAFFSTLIFALFWGTLFMRFNYMICPVHDLGISAWNSIQCKPNPVFVWRELPLWHPFSIFVSTLVCSLT